MNERVMRSIIVWLCVALIFGGPTAVAVAAGEYLSPAAIVADGRGEKLYIAEATARQVAVFDVATAKVTATISVPAAPTALALTGDGTCLYVTCGGAKGSICIIDIHNAKILRTLPAGHTPSAIVLSPDEKSLYVCNRFDNDVFVIRTEDGELVEKIPVLREPAAAAITPDGAWLYVGNQLPVGSASADSVACNISIINAKTVAFDHDIALPNGSTGLQNLTVSPDGRFVFASHILARYTVPTTQLERGWMNTNAITIIDARRRRLVDTVLLDDVDRGAANPWALACTSDSKYLCVTHAGTDELSVIEIAPMIEKIKSYRQNTGTSGQDYAGGYYGAFGYEMTSNVPNELSFLYGIQKRIKLSGKGARAVAIVERKAYVAEYFTDSLTVVDMNDTSRFRTTSAALGPKVPMTIERRGEMLFNDAMLCFQSWQSCASCHPSDARSDALNWDLLNDGLGNPKNTKSLLLAHQTPPAMITGVRENAEAAVRAGIQYIQFAVRPEEEAVAIDQYLKSLEPVPSPYLVDGKLSESAKRGRKLFGQAGCSSCHQGRLHTDLHQYDVGTAVGVDEGRKFDTPTLVEVWRTAPYLNDGRAATIEEVLKKYNPDDKHGMTSNLTDNEIKDLAQFVLSQ
jgi:YVTN family beta-propeller protein